MSEKRVSSLVRKLVAGCLAAVIVSGMVAIPELAKAAEDIVDGEIVYSQMDMDTYWSTGTKTAPVKENYIFAGWYTADEDENVTAIKEADGIPEQVTTYAKFVPAEVLSVRAQLDTNAETNKNNTEKTYLLSAIQSPDVQFIPTIIMNSAVLALIILAGFTVYGFPLAPLILFLRSFAVGFCDCLLLYNMGSDNIISFI